jgi:hypothetical protein
MSASHPHGPPHGADTAAMPAGPFTVSMTWDYGAKRFTPPYNLLDGANRCIAGHIESRAIAEHIAAALNAAESGASVAA